jgi:hypothetical protein
MNLLRMLFSDWVGILSVFTVGFVLAMAAYLAFYVARHVREDTENQPKAR